MTTKAPQPHRTSYPFNAPDREIALLGLELTKKAAETAHKELRRLGLAGLQVAAVLHHIEQAKSQIGKATDPDTGIIEGDVRLSAGEVYVLRIGGSLLLEELDKAAEKQLKLTVQPDDTHHKANQVRDLVDRLDGQEALAFAQASDRSGLFGMPKEELAAELQEGLDAAGIAATVTVR